MRKFFIGILLLATTATMFAAPRTAEEAAALAADFSNSQFQKSGIKKAVRTKAADMRLIQQVAKPTNSFEPALYVFNKPEGGWVIISADDNYETVIGYSNEGSFDATGKPNVIYMLSHLAEQVDAAGMMSEMEKASYTAAVRKAKKQVEPIAPLLQSKGTGINWNQGAPYNGMCPIDGDGGRCLTGCVATAASQIMAYWQWPIIGEGYTEYEWVSGKGTRALLSVNFGETTYDWNNILQANYEKTSYSQAQADAVALLNFHAGVATHTNYSSTGSSSGTNSMADGLKHFFRYKRGRYIYGNYKDWHDWDTINHWSQLADMYDKDLEAGRPILMGGGGKHGSNGHEYVCEGRDENRMYYINYGWGGSENGYYLLDNMTTSKYEFSYDVDAVLGIYPDTLPRVGVTAISLNKHTMTMTTRETYKLKATITPDTANNDGKYWLSSDRSVASVDYEGNVTAVAPGVATIFAYSCDGGFKDSCKITVSNNGSNPSLIEITDLTDVNKCHWSGSLGKYVLILDNESQGQYPWLEFNLSALTSDWTLAGRYDLSQEYLLAYPSAQDYGNVFYGQSGWLNIGCIDGATHTYQIDGLFSDGKGNNYSFTFTTILNMDNGTLVDQTGDGVINKAITTFVSMGETYHTNVVVDGKLSLPEQKPLSCNELSFVGWTTDADYTSGTTAPTLAQDGDIVTTNTTYYAVYGIPSGVGPYTEVASVTFKTHTEDGKDWYDPGYGHFDDFATDMIESIDNMTFSTGAWLRKGKDGVWIGGSGSGYRDDEQGHMIFNLDNQTNIKKVVINCSKHGDEPTHIRVDMNNAAPDKRRDPIYEVSDNIEHILDRAVATNSIRVGTTCNSAYFKSITLYSGGEQYYSLYTTTNCPTHSISIGTTGGGSATTDVTEANLEDLVTITATPDECSLLAAISVVDADNNTIKVTDNKFVMPASDVTISVSFEGIKHNISITDATHGQIATNVATAAAGETVTITATSDAHYSLSSINAVDADNNLIDIENDGTFIMPCANVTISAEFAEDTKYTVNFYNNGALIDSQELYAGEAAVKPADPTAECNDYAFAGWWNEELAADNTEAKTWLSDFTVSGDADYYAIYRKGESENGGIVTFAAKEDFPSTAALSYTKNTVTLAIGDGVLNNEEEYRCYASKKLTISATDTITKIEFTSPALATAKKWGLNNLSIASGYTYSGYTATWEGKAKSVEFSATAQVRMTSIVVTVGNGGTSGTIYYTSIVNCTPTAIEDSHAEPNSEWIKTIENGQIVIIRGNEKYSIFGQKIQ